MNYYDAVNTAIDLVVETAFDTDQAYLEPRYRQVLREADIHLPDGLPDEELYEILKLEVDKRNARNNKLYPVISWLYKSLAENIEPQMMEDETRLMQAVMSYLHDQGKSISEYT